MTRDEFLGRYAHDLIGMMLDALSFKEPDSPGAFAKLGMKAVEFTDKIKTRVGQMFDALSPPLPVKGEPKAEAPKPAHQTNGRESKPLITQPAKT